MSAAAARRKLLRIGAAFATLAGTGTASRAQAWPSRPIRMVVPYPPGGPTDLLARAVAQKLGDALGQPAVIDNKPGASGNIGAEQVARAAPDGHTLLVNASIHVINPSLFRKLPYDAIRDFAPVTQLASVPLVLVVSPQLPVNSVRELVAYAKANPGKVSFASSSIGAAPHLAGELFKSLAGVDIVHVPYKGSGPAITDLIGGQVTMMIDSLPSSSAQVRAGKLKALGVSTPRRVPSLPDVPTIAEAGLAGFDIDTWYGVWAPAGTPADVVARLQAEIARVLAQPEVRQRFAELGAAPVGSTPAQFAAFNASELERWSKIVELSGAKLD